jgi:uncharacterized protein (UPF0548 family)
VSSVAGVNLAFSWRPIDPAACVRWNLAPPTSTPNGPPVAAVDRYEARVCAWPGERPADTFARVRDRLLAYDIFPPSIVRAAICPSSPITIGATIVQRVRLGPLALEAAVRVYEVWDRSEGGICEAGFGYLTLQGHPECGAATFEVRLDEAGAVTVVLAARSRPGLLLTRIGRPAARAFQRSVTRAALRRLSES